MNLAKLLIPAAFALVACAPAVIPTARSGEPGTRVGLYEGQLRVILSGGRSTQALPAIWNQAELRVESNSLKAVQSSGIIPTSNQVISHDFFLPPGPATVSASLWYGGELVATGSATASISPGPNNVPIVLDTAVGTIKTLAGQPASGSIDALGTAASFADPMGLALASGSLYVADSVSHRIRKIAPDGAVSTLAGWGPGYADGTGWVGNASGSAVFKYPKGVAYDATTEILYVADTGNHVIRKIPLWADPATNSFVTTLAGVVGSFGLLDGVGANSRLNEPCGLAVDSAAGVLYVADSGNHCIRKIDLTTYNVTKYAGTGSEGFLDGSLSIAKFSAPRAVTVDNMGNVYVADTGNHRIRKISTDGTVSTVAGTGFAGPATGSIDVAQFSSPWGLTWHSNGGSGSVLVADTFNHQLRDIDLGRDATDSAYVTIMVGGNDAYMDGTETNARFSFPRAVLFEGMHKIYVSDTGNQRIRLGIGPGAGAPVPTY